MKQIFFFWLFVFGFAVSLWAQSHDSVEVRKDSATDQNDSSQIKSTANSTDLTSDSLKHLKIKALKFRNRLLNSDAEPVSLAVQAKRPPAYDILFYLICGILLLLALFKYFYSRYFANLFRVFFNTSLRQSQLTDQLLQAKLPSLLFNLFFVISGGMYVYILLLEYDLIKTQNNSTLILSSVALLGLIYFIKFCILKLTGWITGYEEITNTYIFVIFLINKIVGIFLVPFIIVTSFSDPTIAKIAVLVSLMSIGVFLLLRFFRSYGLIQNQLKINRFHFFIYIIGVEILPLMLIYKGLMLFLSKNL